MSRRLAGLFLSLFGVAALAGCGLNLFAHREPWRTEAEEACLAQREVQATAYTEPMRAINGPGTCGMDHPFRVAAFAQGTIPLSSKAVLACPAISTVDRWLADVVGPAAESYFGSGLAELKVGSYACRSQNNQAGAQISEHAYGNAVDVMAFRFADGRELSVVKGWRGEPQEQDFLREVFLGACRYFTTVLAPGSDPFHYDHIHMDLARHGSQRHICKPVIKWTPRAPMAAAPASDGATPPAASPAAAYPARGAVGATATAPSLPGAQAYPQQANPQQAYPRPYPQQPYPQQQAYPQQAYPRPASPQPAISQQLPVRQARPPQPDFYPAPAGAGDPADEDGGEDEAAPLPPARPAAAAQPARRPPVYATPAPSQATLPQPAAPQAAPPSRPLASSEPMVLRPPRPVGGGLY